MIEDLLSNVIVNAPNFLGFVLLTYTQYKIINRLMDKIDKCNCPPHKQQQEAD